MHVPSNRKRHKASILTIEIVVNDVQHVLQQDQLPLDGLPCPAVHIFPDVAPLVSDISQDPAYIAEVTFAARSFQVATETAAAISADHVGHAVSIRGTNVSRSSR